MTQHLKIDFVSDVACPWCVIGLRGLEQALGLRGLEQALANAADAVEADITFQPFELNPRMPAAGQNLVEHITEKYGSTAEQSAASRAMIRSRGAEVGFTFNMSEESRIYNTFDAHRLLHWAGTVGRQQELKLALFKANFTDGANVSDHGVLVEAAVAAGLDGDRRARSWRRGAMPRRSAMPSGNGSPAASDRSRPSSSMGSIMQMADLRRSAGRCLRAGVARHRRRGWASLGRRLTTCGIRAGSRVTEVAGGQDRINLIARLDAVSPLRSGTCIGATELSPL